MGEGKAPKEKVLHTRVPESLDTQIKALADALRVPVSSLVRNILEDSVAVIDSATTGIDETLKNVSRNVRSLSARAKADHRDLRRGWTEFQTVLSQGFRAPAKETAKTRRDPPSDADPSAGVLGWQSLTLNVPARCARCEARLLPGETAHLGIREHPGARVLICSGCLPQRPHPKEGDKTT